MSPKILVLSAADVDRALSMQDAISVVRRAVATEMGRRLDLGKEVEL
jgi:hypothetical protein